MDRYCHFGENLLIGLVKGVVRFLHDEHENE